MLLEGKTAVVYGAGGAVGGAVAKAFAAEGAYVALAGRSVERLETIEGQIGRTGGRSSIAVVDAFDERSVEDHLRQLAGDTGSVDICFNAVGLSFFFGKPLTSAASDTFLNTIEMGMQTQFATATAAGRQMAQAGSGAILTIVASPSRVPTPNQGTLGIVGAATEAFYRQLAMDIGPQGVRVICICSAGSTDAPDVSDAMNHLAEKEGVSREAFEKNLTAGAALKRLPSLAEVGAAAALMASDHASAITATSANVTCGQLFM